MMSEIVSLIVATAAIMAILVPCVIFWVHCLDDLDEDEEFQKHKDDQKWLDEHYPWP